MMLLPDYPVRAHRKDERMQDHHAARAPATLWASLSEGRPPRDPEVQSVAAKIWQDVYCRDSKLAWSQVEVGSAPYRKSIAAALAALGVAPVRSIA